MFTQAKGTWKQVAELKGSDTYDGEACQGDLCPRRELFRNLGRHLKQDRPRRGDEPGKGSRRVYVFTESNGRWSQSRGS